MEHVRILLSFQSLIKVIQLVLLAHVFALSIELVIRKHLFVFCFDSAFIRCVLTVIEILYCAHVQSEEVGMGMRLWPYTHACMMSACQVLYYPIH